MRSLINVSNVPVKVKKQFKDEIKLSNEWKIPKRNKNFVIYLLISFLEAN